MRNVPSQNFLFDPGILKRIIQIANIKPDDTVLEIGPGPGRLTRLLSERAGRVVAVELDRKLYEKLTVYMRDRDNVELIRGDALRYPYEDIKEKFKVVANIPYHITTPIIFKLLEQRDRLLSMTLTIQKEVAERIVAKPGSKKYGVPSLMVQYWGRPRMKFLISRKAFRPVPRVDSACLHVDVLKKPSVEVIDEGLFFHVIKKAFSHRRKTLHNSLKGLLPDVDKILEEASIVPSLRPEVLSIKEFASLADAFTLSGLKYEK
jgi:16S rRNA (adenine1518-N6/adenine1519-N6)-dimethyltransferase